MADTDTTDTDLRIDNSLANGEFPRFNSKSAGSIVCDYV